MSDASPRSGPRLPPEAMSAMADLVAAGYRVSQALEVLPRRSLKARVAAHLEREVAALTAGAPLDLALERLGLEITAVVLRGAQSRAAAVEAALRADAAASKTAADSLRRTRYGVLLFGAAVGTLILFTFVFSFFVVPRLIRGITSALPASDVPPTLAEFERFRDVWLMLGAGFLLAVVALVIVYAVIVGRAGWKPFLHDLRLYLPFLRRHALATSSARLMEALAHEQAVGIPADRTLRRTGRREPVPALRGDLALAEARLASGDSWAACLRGTRFDTPMLADLAGLASRGARPTEGWRWAAARCREQAVKALRRAVIAGAIVVLLPSLLYSFALLDAALVTSAIAQVEGLTLQVEQLTDEIDRMFEEATAPP